MCRGLPVKRSSAQPPRLEKLKLVQDSLNFAVSEGLSTFGTGADGGLSCARTVADRSRKHAAVAVMSVARTFTIDPFLSARSVKIFSSICFCEASLWEASLWEAWLLALA